MNQSIVNAAYAVRGEIVILAEKLNHQLAKGEKLPFDEIVFCNIGNPQELGQTPITFFRQVLSLIENPDLMKTAPDAFPPDAISRAQFLLDNIPGGSGAYSNSQGIEVIRKNVAKFIEDRDGFPSDPEEIFLTDGASSGVSKVLNCTIRGKEDGILIPIPQYPLYSASIPLFGGSQLEYYLDEENGWGMDINEMQKSVDAAKAKGITARALVVINPGNPTGQCLGVDNMKEVIDFCSKNRLILMADEVYQTNSYIKPFNSFKKVLRQMGTHDDFEMISYHSVSKGVVGECGKRGGYMEMVGIDPAVKEQIYKICSISLCSNVIGQIVVDLMVNPPKPGDPSYDQYKQEHEDKFNSLSRRAKSLSGALNNLEGVTCNDAEGAMYLFPRVRLPAKQVAFAKEQGKAPDGLYCIDLLKNTGICVVPGSGFGQRDGTFHFRTTFLPPEDKIDSVVERMKVFHSDFMKKWT
eukprot:TRINITY_DN21847_c0_g1_i1.p1 TRINITY_DN21847_c0_g1~~TRINITY_DN21847_c0_g1_i1.p1  ORF type:complete len:527 (-),score=79.79 TRINITY_DN21847_c0_g1_i1:167-1564(-)